MFSGEEDTDLHTPVYSASDSDAPQSFQVVVLPVVLTKLPSYTALDVESQQPGYGSSWISAKASFVGNYRGLICLRQSQTNSENNYKLIQVSLKI